MKALPILLSGVLVWLACGTQYVLVQPEQIHEEQRVVLTLQDGAKISGVALRANSKSILLREDDGNEQIIFVKDIAAAKGPEPIFDDNDKLISEAEIDSVKTNANKRAYAFVGGVISLGVSYLAGALAERELLQEEHDALIYSGMAAGTLAGAALFASSGAQKDRDMAIQYVLESRSHAEEILALPDNETDKLIKLKIAETIAQRQQVEKKIALVLQEIEELDRLIQQQNNGN